MYKPYKMCIKWKRRAGGAYESGRKMGDAKAPVAWTTSLKNMLYLKAIWEKHSEHDAKRIRALTQAVFQLSMTKCNSMAIYCSVKSTCAKRV